MRALEDIERDAKAATVGPWGWHSDAMLMGDDEVVLFELDGPDVSREGADANFIANARTDIPDLIARVRELEGAIGAKCGLCYKLFCTPDHCPLYPYRKEA
jgi:hypothetical protein